MLKNAEAITAAKMLEMLDKRLTSATEEIARLKAAQSAEGAITLTLSKRQATTLLAITYRVGGDPEGRRGHIDTIRSALQAAGVQWKPSITYKSGGITLSGTPVRQD